MLWHGQNEDDIWARAQFCFKDPPALVIDL